MSHEPIRDEDDIPWCADCQVTELTWWECETCGGEGYDGHDCGEDSCVCIYPEENIPCGVCAGRGGYWTCATCNERDRDDALASPPPGESKGT